MYFILQFAVVMPMKSQLPIEEAQKRAWGGEHHHEGHLTKQNIFKKEVVFSM